MTTCKHCLWDISQKHPGAAWRLAWGGSEDDPYFCDSGNLGAHDPMTATNPPTDTGRKEAGK